MKILAVSDEISQTYYDHYTPGKLDSFDLILSCGDLKREYLEFLVTMAHCPLLYVPGNHDDSFAENPPEGCTCIDGKLVEINGIRILGMGGSFRYRSGKNMYTEKQMTRRLIRVRRKIKTAGGIDILLTHAPASGVDDLADLSHRGFECFTEILDTWKPAYMIHGHIHLRYGHRIPRITEYDKTTVINACGHYILNI